MIKKLKIGVVMDAKPGDRKKAEPTILEVIESPSFTLKDLVLKQRDVKESINKSLLDKGYQIRSMSVVADPDVEYDVVVVVQAPIFGTSRKKPVRRSGPQGGAIGRKL